MINNIKWFTRNTLNVEHNNNSYKNACRSKNLITNEASEKLAPAADKNKNIY